MNDTELTICTEAYKQYKTLSAAYLMRKLKCDKDHALTLIDEFFDNYFDPEWDENIKAEYDSIQPFRFRVTNKGT